MRSPLGHWTALAGVAAAAAGHEVVAGLALVTALVLEVVIYGRASPPQ